MIRLSISLLLLVVLLHGWHSWCTVIARPQHLPGKYVECQRLHDYKSKYSCLRALCSTSPYMNFCVQSGCRKIMNRNTKEFRKCVDRVWEQVRLHAKPVHLVDQTGRWGPISAKGIDQKFFFKFNVGSHSQVVTVSTLAHDQISLPRPGLATLDLCVGTHMAVGGLHRLQKISPISHNKPNSLTHCSSKIVGKPDLNHTVSFQTTRGWHYVEIISKGEFHDLSLKVHLGGKVTDNIEELSNGQRVNLYVGYGMTKRYKVKISGTKGDLTVSTSGGKPGSVLAGLCIGKTSHSVLVCAKKIEGTSATVFTKNLPPGYYYISVVSSSHAAYVDAHLSMQYFRQYISPYLKELRKQLKEQKTHETLPLSIINLQHKVVKPTEEEMEVCKKAKEERKLADDEKKQYQIMKELSGHLGHNKNWEAQIKIEAKVAKSKTREYFLKAKSYEDLCRELHRKHETPKPFPRPSTTSAATKAAEDSRWLEKSMKQGQEVFGKIGARFGGEATALQGTVLSVKITNVGGIAVVPKECPNCILVKIALRDDIKALLKNPNFQSNLEADICRGAKQFEPKSKCGQFAEFSFKGSEAQFTIAPLSGSGTVPPQQIADALSKASATPNSVLRNGKTSREIIVDSLVLTPHAHNVEEKPGLSKSLLIIAIVIPIAAVLLLCALGAFFKFRSRDTSTSYHRDQVPMQRSGSSMS